MTDDRPVDALATALSASAASDRTAAAEALQARADRDPSAVASVAPELAAGLTDVDGTVRTATAAAVADAADADSAAVGALAGHLADRVADDDHLAVRHHAAYALARVGETDPVAAQRALPALVEALAAADDALRRLATLAVAAVADADPSVVADELAGGAPQSGTAADESTGGDATGVDDGVEDDASGGTIDPETLATRLASGATDDDATVRRRASRALARLVEAEAGVAPVPDPEPIRTALVADAAVVRRDAAFLLARAAATAPESVPDDETLVTDLRDRLSDHGAVAVHAAAALSDLADRRPATVATAVPDLATAATHDRPDVRANATLALGRLADTAPDRVAETVETLTELVTADAVVVRANAAFALSRLAEADPEAVRPAMEPLLARLEDDAETDAVRGHAGTALDTLRSELSPGATLGPPGDDSGEIPRGAAAVANGRGVVDEPGGTAPESPTGRAAGDDTEEYTRGAPTGGAGGVEPEPAETVVDADTPDDPVDSGTTGDPVDPDTTDDPVDPDTTDDPVDSDTTGDAADADTTDPSEFDEAVAFGEDAAFDAEGEFDGEGEFGEEATFETDDADSFGDDGAGDSTAESTGDGETRAAEAGFADEGTEDVFDGPDVTPFASESADATGQGDGDDVSDTSRHEDTADED